MSPADSSLLPRLSVRRPVTVIMAYTAMLVLGAIAYARLPIDLMPAGFSPPFLGVWIPYPDSTPEEVEQLIARPAEGMLGTIPGVRSIRSTSSADGCWVFLRFHQDTDMDVAYADVRDRMDRVMPELPDDVERVWIRRFADDDMPVLWGGLEIRRQFDDPYRLLDETLVRELMRIDGVANVELFGVPQRSIQVYVDQAKLKAHGIDLAALVRRLQADNFSISSGYVVEGGRKIYVRSIGRYRSIEEVAALRVSAQGVRLGDIATVAYGQPERRSISRIGGRRGAMVAVRKESTANTVAVGTAVMQRVRELFATTPALAGITFHPLFDQASFIDDSIEQLQGSMLWGAVFAVLVLLAFLRHLRMTLAVTLAMPFSLLVAVIVLYFVGWSLNIVTMMGIMICVGLVVDNSIVVVESIFRRLQQGEDAPTAAETGASQVVLAITIATLTTVVVIVPLVIMNDDVGFSFYMLRLGTPMVVGVLASLLVALTLIPLLTVRLMAGGTARPPGVTSRLAHAYARAADWVLDHRLDACLLMALLVASAAVPAARVTFTDDAEGNIGNIEIDLDLPRNLSLEELERVVARIEASLDAYRDAWRIRTVTSNFRAGRGELEIFLQPPERLSWWRHLGRRIAVRWFGAAPGPPGRERVIALLPNVLPALPGVDYEIQEAGDNQSSDRLVRLALYGDDSARLAEIGRTLARRLRGMPGVIDAHSDLERGQDELQVTIDRAMADKVGVSPRAVAQLIAFSLRGVQLPELRLGDREVDLRVQLEREDRRTLAQLRDMTVVTTAGSEVPLGAIARFRVARAPGQITRRDGKTAITIRIVTDEERIEAVYASIDEVMAATPLPNGMSWDKGERFSRLQESNRAQNLGLLLVVLLVFILMAVLFESLLLPFSVILTLPFAIVGLFWALYLTGTSNNLFTGIGMLVLVGIVVNNAIVLVDLTNRLRLQGYDRRTALTHAVEMRLRPIAMTAMTTIFGLLPMAVGNVDMIGISYAGMGRGMAGGLLLHSLVTPLAVPLLYSLLDDLRAHAGLLARRALAAVAGRPVDAAGS